MPEGAPVLEPVASARRAFTSLPRARRELLYLGLALIVGLVIVPLLTWILGTHILGPYSRGTQVTDRPLALLGDFYRGLEHGYLVFWVVALGPIVFLYLVRLLIALWRRQPKTADDA